MIELLVLQLQVCTHSNTIMISSCMQQLGTVMPVTDTHESYCSSGQIATVTALCARELM